MNRNLEDIKNRIRPILQKYGINKAGIFGSAARGKVMPNDIAYEISPENPLAARI